MKISVILSTYNRGYTLTVALESIAASQLPECVEWEVLVVDNNSKDHTRQVVERFCNRHPRRFRYLFESRQGLSHARNRGIQEARGEIIAFMDDDVTVAPNWLRELMSPFQNPEYAGAGGRILPAQDFTPPSWLLLDDPMNLAGTLALFDLGPEAGQLTKPPYGTNMAYRRAMFEKYGGFRTDLGRSGDNLMSNEDTEFGHRLLRFGQRLWYQPSAVVYHPIPKKRLTKKYFRAWWFAYGRAMLRQDGLREPYLGVPRHFLSIFSRTIRWMLATDPKVRFYWETRIWMAAGELAEIYGRQPRAKNHKRPETLCA